MSFEFDSWLASRRATSWRSSEGPQGCVARAYADSGIRNLTAEKFGRLLNSRGYRPRRERGAWTLIVPVQISRAGAAE